MADKEITEGYVRSRYRDLEPTSDVDNKSFAKYVSLAPVTALGHQQVTVSTSVVTVNPPAGTKRMQLRCLNAPINFRDDGVNPTNTSGFPLFAGDWLLYDNEVTDFRMVLDASATQDADVRLAFYA